MNYQTERVAIDITDLGAARDGSRIINALLSNGASLYRTKRGCKALLIKKESFEILKLRMKFSTEDTYDGLVTITPAPPVAKALAA